MIRLMWDSVDPDAIPPGAAMVAGYWTGTYKWPAEAWDKFPGAALVKINTTGDPAEGGDCVDVETGAATPQDAINCMRAWESNPYRCVYASRSNMPIIDELAAAAKITYFRWYATLDGSLRIGGLEEGTPAAVQFAGASVTGMNVDCSIVWEGGWHPAPGLNLAEGAQAAMDTAEHSLALAYSAVSGLVTMLR